MNLTLLAFQKGCNLLWVKALTVAVLKTPFELYASSSKENFRLEPRYITALK